MKARTRRQPAPQARARAARHAAALALLGALAGAPQAFAQASGEHATAGATPAATTAPAAVATTSGPASGTTPGTAPGGSAGHGAPVLQISRIASSDPDREPDEVIAARAAAARRTAESSIACAQIRPFYWEIGDRGKVLASGQIGRLFSAETSMPVASASKLVYAAFVAQERDGLLNATDIAALSLRSGQVGFRTCRRDDTVHSCAARPDNGRLDEAAVGKFAYGGGHMQVHADKTMHLGELDGPALARLVSDSLGLHTTQSDFNYVQPQLAGGLRTSPRVYGEFLRRVLDGSLAIGRWLDRPSFCTSPALCPTETLHSPYGGDEAPRYSIGHWIEDREHGDGAFSSPGAFGFYPWIDATRTWYGIVGRAALGGLQSADEDQRPARASMACGRALRRAWATKEAEL
ncbi:hypothetical protein [Derxia gummosa]|uniref:Beta-lactamase enzyme family protein n=1 Tax=Derxia gummosa DSM 723 TaxID=1121388 RepID=A0A8B6XAW5_9BURK|nr:hypothetical protein [Derxia gummosa]